MKKIALLLTIAIISSCQLFAQVDLQNGLRFHLPFTNGNNDDVVVGGYIITSNNVNTTSDRFGNSQSAYNFPGPVSFLGYGDVLDTYFTGSNKQFTFSVWIKPEQSLNNAAIFSKLADSNCSADEREFLLRILQDKINFTFHNSLGGTLNVRIFTGQTTIDTTWQHIVMTYDGTSNTNNGVDRVKLYLNCLQETLTYDGTFAGPLNHIIDGDAHLALGNFLSSTGMACADSSFNFLGKIDDLRVYDRILNAAEINALCSDTIATGVERTISELMDAQIIIYPNPSQGVINFKNITLGDKRVYIYDLQGKLLGSHQLQMQLEVGYLETGLYLVSVVDEKSGKTSTHKVSVQKN